MYVIYSVRPLDTQSRIVQSRHKDRTLIIWKYNRRTVQVQHQSLLLPFHPGAQPDPRFNFFVLSHLIPSAGLDCHLVQTLLNSNPNVKVPRPLIEFVLYLAPVRILFLISRSAIGHKPRNLVGVLHCSSWNHWAVGHSPCWPRSLRNSLCGSPVLPRLVSSTFVPDKPNHRPHLVLPLNLNRRPLSSKPRNLRRFSLPRLCSPRRPYRRASQRRHHPVDPNYDANILILGTALPQCRSPNQVQQVSLLVRPAASLGALRHHRTPSPLITRLSVSSWQSPCFKIPPIHRHGHA